MNGTPPEAAPGDAADAARRNMGLLIQLRWIAVLGQLVTIAVVQWGLGIALPLAVLLPVPGLLVLVNLASLLVLRRRTAISNAQLISALLLDVVALTWQLHHSGGATNPFASLFLLQVVVGALLLDRRSGWIVFCACWFAVIVLILLSSPLPLPDPYRSRAFGLYLVGNLFSLMLIGGLLFALVTRINENLRARDHALAAIRQQEVEEAHIVRMGLLASGAAHELGTPLASLSVILSDWQRMPRLTADAELSADIADMKAAVARCKSIVTGILNAAGEARGVSPSVTTVHSFLAGMVAEWREGGRAGAIRFEDRFGEDLAIVSDTALKQAIGNLVDNALEVSPDWVRIVAEREEEALVLTVEDRGPGFAEEALAAFGKPYNSTKGRPGGGLGLFLLVNVLRKLGGTVEARNLPGRGAAIRLALPLQSVAYAGEAR